MMFVSMRQMETKSFQREVTEVLNFGTPKTRVKPLSHNSKVIKVKFLAVNGTISTSAWFWVPLSISQSEYGTQRSFKQVPNKDSSTTSQFTLQYGILPMNLFLDLVLGIRHAEFGIYVVGKMWSASMVTQTKSLVWTLTSTRILLLQLVLTIRSNFGICVQLQTLQ